MSNKLLLISRSEPVCPNCTVMKNMLNEAGVEYEELDIAKDTNATEKYSISSIPVSIIQDENGEEVSRFIGIKPPELIKAMLE